MFTASFQARSASPICQRPSASKAFNSYRAAKRSSFWRQKRNLVLVVAKQHRPDFEKISRYVRELAPDVKPIIVKDRKRSRFHPAMLLRPTLVFSPMQLIRLAPFRGAVFQGQYWPKSREYRALDAAGVPVPRWRLLTETEAPNLDDFSQYVVCKPDFGGKGAEVKIKRKGKVRWKQPEHNRGAFCPDLIVQDFIYTGQWPISYRVTSLFGKTLWSVKTEAARSRVPLESPQAFRGTPGQSMSIVSSGRGCTYEMNYDPEVIALGERAHAAFPTIPFLGIDIIREQPSGKLYVLEVNSCGTVWHFSSKKGLNVQRMFNLDFEAQFDGLRKAAEVLVDQVRWHAC